MPPVAFVWFGLIVCWDQQLCADFCSAYAFYGTQNGEEVSQTEQPPEISKKTNCPLIVSKLRNCYIFLNVGLAHLL